MRISADREREMFQATMAAMKRNAPPGIMELYQQVLDRGPVPTAERNRLTTFQRQQIFQEAKQGIEELRGEMRRIGFELS